MKTKSDPTSDGLGPGNEARHTGDAVETTAAEAVLTDYRESVEGQQHRLSSIAQWQGWLTKMVKKESAYSDFKSNVLVFAELHSSLPCK